MKDPRPPFVDSHAHLTDPKFDDDREEVMRRASAAGVDRILSISIDVESARSCLVLAERYGWVSVAAGIHPSRADEFEPMSAETRSLLEHPDVKAVGEIGLDFGRCSVSGIDQMHAFRAQMRWAVETDLPVAIHDREAHDDVMAVLREFRPRGVLHCFSGDEWMADTAADMGLYISLAGNLTYKNASRLYAVARSTPLELLLVETDSPYLPPEGLRGTRNEPANVPAVVAAVARLRGEPEADVSRAAAENAARLFGWPMGLTREPPAGRGVAE